MRWHDENRDTVHDDASVKGFVGEYRWLSNFWPCRIEFDGMVFDSVEAAYQAAKCQDREVRKLFVGLNASASKKLGRKVKLRADWNSVKEDVMRELTRLKYAKGQLREQLLATGGKYLEETNWWNDVYWGVCNGRGKNRLGHIIMETRDEIGL